MRSDFQCFTGLNQKFLTYLRLLREMKVDDVLKCSLPNWYEEFKEYTIESLVLPLPQDVLTYLKDNGTVVLPKGSQPNDNDDFSDDPEEDEATAPDLKDFTREISEAISVLGGCTFPKLNFSSPQDARWVGFNYSLECSTPGDVYLLLKSSSFITHDLEMPFKDCVDKDEADTNIEYNLVLRKWMDINSSLEFRCFVKENELVGLSQRDVSQSFSSVIQDRDNIRRDITRFWNEVIEDVFPLDNYTFDVYRPAEGRITLIDFNPFGVTTDSLLFSWAEFGVIEDTNTVGDHQNNGELETIEEISGDHLPVEGRPEFRYIGGATGVQPHPHWKYSLPSDITDLMAGEDPNKLIDLLELTRKTQENESSDDSDSNEEIALER